MKCSDKTSISWSLEAEDDVLDALRFFFEKGVVSDNFVKRYLNPEIDDGEDMRFRAVCKGHYWEIEDGFDKESPLNGITYVLKGNAIKVRDWLNENVKKVTFKDKVRKVISELWDDNEIVVDECMGYTAVTEIKETCVTPSDIRAKLDDCYIEHHNICSGKSVFKISEGKE